MLDAVMNAVAPVMLTIVAGFAWGRLKGGFEWAALTPLVIEIGTPCLIVSSLIKSAITPEAFAVTAAASLTALCCFAFTGSIVLWAFGLRLQTYLPSLSFPNAGNLGLPLALYAFGAEGLSHAIVFFAISSIINHSVGQAMAAGTADWRGIARMPAPYAIATGLVCAYFHVTPPVWLTRALDLTGAMAVPLMLLMLGAALGKLQAPALGRAAAVSALRICSGAAIGMAVAKGFGLEGPARAVLILQCAMPVAVYNYLYAQRWNNEPEEVAGLVFVSTAVSSVTTPLLLSTLMAGGLYDAGL